MFKSIRSWLPVKNIENGVVEMKNGTFCKVLEVFPINFSLKSYKEQESILYQYKNFLHSCNFDIQILVQSKKGNLDNHILKVKSNMEKEKNEEIKNLMKEYINMVQEETLKTAISKKFYIIFSSKNIEKHKIKKSEALIDLQEKTLKIKESLGKCGNEVKEFDKENSELIDIFYTYMNPITSEIQKLKEMRYEYKGD